MALQVSNYTVVNNSRQLTNITGIDATTAAAIGAGGVGGDVNISVTAGSSVTQYEPVYYDPVNTSYVNLDATFGTNILPFTDAQYSSNYNIESMAYNPDSGVLLHLTANGTNIDIWRWDDGSGNYCKFQDRLAQANVTQNSFHSFGYNIQWINVIYLDNDEFLVGVKTNSITAYGTYHTRILHFDGSSSTGTWRGSWHQTVTGNSNNHIGSWFHIVQDKKYPNNFAWVSNGMYQPGGASTRGYFKPFRINRSTYSTSVGSQFYFHTRYSGTNYSTDYSKPIYHNGRFVIVTVPYTTPGGYPYGFRFKYIQINTSNGTSILQGQNTTTYHLMVPPSMYSYPYRNGISTGLQVLNDDIIFAGPKPDPSNSSYYNITLYKLNFSGASVSYGTSIDTGIRMDNSYGYCAIPLKQYINGTEQEIYIDGMNRSTGGTKAAVYRWNGSTWSLVETKNASIADLYNTATPANDAVHLQLFNSYTKYAEPIYSASNGAVSAFIGNNNATMRPYQFQGYNLTDYSFAGFAQNTVSSGQSLNVRLFGVTNTTKNNLIKGQFYTVNDFGDFVLATSDNTGYGTALGKAISTTEMLAGLQG